MKRKKSGVEYLAQHPGWKSKSSDRPKRKTGPARKQITGRSLLDSDKELGVLDEALNSAESILVPLLRKHSPDAIAAAFAQHVDAHLKTELTNVKAHGHRNDDPDEKPKPTTYESLLDLCRMVAAGNTEFDVLEERAREVEARIED